MKKVFIRGFLAVFCLMLQPVVLVSQSEDNASQQLSEMFSNVRELYPEDISEQDISNVQKLFERYANPSLTSWIPGKKVLATTALGVLGSVVYGVLHDQVTARMCIEYFNSNAVPHHKALLDKINFKWKDSPTAVALLWGTVATWWVGLPLGLSVGSAARLGPLPKLPLKDLIKPTGVYAAFVAGSALLAGLVGYFSAKSRINEDLNGFEPLNKGFGFRNIDKYVPKEKQAAFYSNCSSHQAAYISGGVGALGLIAWIIYKRSKMFKEEKKEASLSLEKIMNKLKTLRN